MTRFTVGLLLSLLLVLAGCSTSTVVYHGSGRVTGVPLRVKLPIFVNATDDEHAARCMTDLTASALAERGVDVLQVEAEATGGATPGKAGAGGAPTRYLVQGTVDEYRYKTDLDGDPAVGVTVRVVDSVSGHVVWQGSGMKVGVFFASLTTTAQKVARAVVGRIPDLFLESGEPAVVAGPKK